LWFDLGNQHVHLLLKDRPDSRSPRHFALRVADAQAARAYFHEHGLATEETTPIPGADRFFIYDPDFNRIEIIQWMRPYGPTEHQRGVRCEGSGVRSQDSSALTPDPSPLLRN